MRLSQPAIHSAAFNFEGVRSIGEKKKRAGRLLVEVAGRPAGIGEPIGGLRVRHTDFWNTDFWNTDFWNTDFWTKAY
jgi:hypothetical protein